MTDISPPSLVGSNVIEEMCAMAASMPEGCFVEVGVYKGGTAWHLSKVAQEQSRKLFLYDTFTGIPYKDEIDRHVVGDFSDTYMEDILLSVPSAVTTKGVFPGSAVEMPPVAFVHLDCDQYRSVRDSSLFLSPLMVSGGVMWFDDYECLPGAEKAVEELFSGRIKTAKCGKVYVCF